MIKIGKKPRQLADRFDAIDTGLRPSRTEGRGETTGRPVRFRVRPSSSLPAPLRSGTGFVPSPEPSLRGAVRSSPVAPLVPRAAPPSPGRRKRLPLCGFLEWIARSGTCFAPAPLRSGTASLRHRLRSSPEPTLRGASTLRSLCFAGASARSFHGVSPPPTPASFGHRLVPPRSPLYAGAVSGCACNQVDIFEPGSDYKLLTGSPPAPCRAPVSHSRTLSS